MKRRDLGKRLRRDQPYLPGLFIFYTDKLDISLLFGNLQGADLFPIQREAIVKRSLGGIVDGRNRLAKVAIHQFFQFTHQRFGVRALLCRKLHEPAGRDNVTGSRDANESRDGAPWCATTERIFDFFLFWGSRSL